MQIRPTGNCFTNSHKGHHKVRNVQFGTEMTVKIMHISCVELGLMKHLLLHYQANMEREGYVKKKPTKTTTKKAGLLQCTHAVQYEYTYLHTYACTAL